MYADQAYTCIIYSSDVTIPLIGQNDFVENKIDFWTTHVE